MFVPEAALIALREGLEAFLITGLLLGLVTRLGRPDARKHVWLGFTAAVAASLATGFVVQRWLFEAFEERGGAEVFELAAALSAVAVLTYMVVWMWRHTRALMATLRKQVQVALTTGALAGIVFLTFASVIREGLEVVLFYSALLADNAPVDIAWSGVVGFVASALIVIAILRGSGTLDLQRFFGVTGLLLVFIAGGLLVHSVHAATDLGYIPPAGSVWDTSGVIADDSAAGRVLHAIVGYTATPTALQAVLYFAYVFGVGGWYVASLGFFTRRTTDGTRVRRARTSAAALVVLLVSGTVLAGAANPGPVVAGHAHGGGDGDASGLTAASLPEGEKVGVLLRSHGEPVHYNETTYRSFADFVENLLVMLGMEQLLLVDQGTVLVDASRPFEPGFHLDAELMDAWTHAHAGPAVYVGSPFPQLEESRVPLMDGYYLAPGGPGLGEPDVLELAGLSAWASWLLMENASPMHHDKLATLEAAERALKARFGDRVVVEKSFHIQPRLGPGESDADAGAVFAREDVALVVDAYTSALHSDVMDACMMRPHLHHAFESAGYAGDLVHATPIGLTDAYAEAVGAHVADLVRGYPADEKLVVFLTHHGMDPDAESPCTDGPDKYHAQAGEMYARAERAVRNHTDRDVIVLQVYGAGAGAPDDGVLSPQEALAVAREHGATTVLDLPFELTGNGFDNLVNQRASYGLAPGDAPHYDGAYETHLTVNGMTVRILSAAWGAEARGLALAEVTMRALADALGESGGDEEDGHGH